MNYIRYLVEYTKYALSTTKKAAIEALINEEPVVVATRNALFWGLIFGIILILMFG